MGDSPLRPRPQEPNVKRLIRRALLTAAVLVLLGPLWVGLWIIYLLRAGFPQ